MMNRFGDIDASFKRLTPVYGFRSAKYAPIDNALEPIVSQIDALPHYIKTAKKYCHFPSEHGLTRDESAAIYIYTMEWGDTALYRVLNQALRSENRQALKIWFPYLRLFDEALHKLPTVKEVLWRGISLDIGKTFVRNQIVTWWSVNSCSSSVNVIKNFIGKEKNSTLFLIEAVNGKKVSGYTEFENEEEIVLPMGSQFRVKSDPLEQSNGSYLVHLIELDDDENEPSATATDNMLPTGTASHENSSFTPARGTDVALAPSVKWSLKGTTVAGGHGKGRELNQLDHPRGLYVHDDLTIYVADGDNQRIMAWPLGATQGQVVAGGNGCGNGLHQLHYPSDIIVDRSTDTLVICDWRNRRVVGWPRHGGKKGKILVDNIDCFGLTMDDHGFLYVTDFVRHEVRRFRSDADSQGTVVAGGNGIGNRNDQLNWPAHLFIDRDHSLYISDDYNHRVMKWVEGAKEGSVVAGGHGMGNEMNQLRYAKGVLIDNMGTVYVADWENHRVMRWPQGSTGGSVLVGGNCQGNGPKQFDGCGGLSFDNQGHLYVVDFGNHRVQRFSIL
ncbi:unnamed protein product [Rotaria magnacalcarata]